MKYSQESSLETVYQEMLDSIYKAAKQKLICLLDQKWFFKGSVTYPDLHNINFELKYCGDEEEYFITGICGIRNGVSLSKIILKCDISNGIDSKYTKFEVEYDERKYLDDIEKNINAILKNNRSYKYFCEDYERYTRQNPFQYVRELIKSHSFEIEKEVDPGPDWMNYYYPGEYGEDSLKIYIDNSEFGYDDNEEPPFDYFCIDVGDRFQLSLYEVDSVPIRELFLLIERSNISIENFLIRTTAMHCIKQDHHLHRIRALVWLDNGKEIKEEEIDAGFCTECNQYFITEPEYEKLCQKGRICCRVITFSEYKKLHESGYHNWAETSLLRSYGYSVNAQDNLSDNERERILAFIIENKIMSVDDIINFLEWLVHRNPSENFYLARLKWNKDIEFLRKYKPIEGIVRIGNIYQKKVLTQI